jgi:hypothetical protein
VSGVRGRRITALVITGLLALVATGCGGGEPLAPEVPGPPAEVKVPQSAQAPGDAAAQNTAGNSGTGTSDSATGSGSSGDTGADATPTPTPAGTGTDQGGGAAAPDATADSPTNDTPPPDGSNAQQFEDFCAQNPGAC